MLHINSIVWCQLVLTVPSQIMQPIGRLGNLGGVMSSWCYIIRACVAGAKG